MEWSGACRGRRAAGVAEGVHTWCSLLRPPGLTGLTGGVLLSAPGAKQTSMAQPRLAEAGCSLIKANIPP